MSARVIAEGTELPSYDVLAAQLQEGETLHATWLRDPLMDPHEDGLTSQAQLDTIVSKTIHGYYADLKVEARKDD